MSGHIEQIKALVEPVKYTSKNLKKKREYGTYHCNACDANKPHDFVIATSGDVECAYCGDVKGNIFIDVQTRTAIENLLADYERMEKALELIAQQGFCEYPDMTREDMCNEAQRALSEEQGE